MNRELGLLNFLCLLIAVAFLALAIISVIASGDFFTTDNLFIITVSLVMALMFGVNPLLYLKAEGKLPIPFLKRPAISSPASTAAQIRASTPPLLDAKGRAVPPDVKAIVAHLNQAEVRHEEA